MCYCDYDSPTVFREKTVRARKLHKCTECGGPILSGEPYKYAFGVWDGNAHSYHTCLECLKVWSWIQRKTECECYAFGEMLGELGEYQPYAKPDAIKIVQTFWKDAHQRRARYKEINNG